MHDALGLKVPLAAPWVNATVPVGVIAPLLVLSVTVAVHVVGTPRATVVGVHAIVVVVVCNATDVTCRLKVFELILWIGSPPYEPVIVSVLGGVTAPVGV